MGAEAEKNQQDENHIPEPTKLPNPNPKSITEAQFVTWKRRKDADASARKDEAARKRAEDITAGLVQMNGRELFEHEPWVLITHATKVSFINSTYLVGVLLSVAFWQ